MHIPNPWLVDYAVYCERYPDAPERTRRRRWLDARNKANNRARKAGTPDPYPDPQQVAVAAMVAQADRNLAAPVDGTHADYERYFALLEEADELHGQLAPTQDTTTFTAPDALPIGIAMTGDWHCGAGGVLYRQLKADLETIRDTDGLYAIGMGDYVENVMPQSKAGTALYSGLFNEPGLQQRYAVTRARIAAGKWLAIAQGNHDAWSYKWAGVSRTDELAAQLGAAYFGEGGGTVFAQVGGERYVVAVRHNTAGNSRINTTNPMRRAFDDWPMWGESCDVICIAHLHFNDLQTATRRGGRCVYLRSGTMKVRDAYAEGKGFKPEYGVPLVILLPDKHKVIAFRGDDFAEGVAYLNWIRSAYVAR